MIFALLFIIAFLIGAGIYFVTRNWMIAVATPLTLFIINAIVDPGDPGILVFTLIFGVTIVFFASLLGCYIVQNRIFERDTTND